MRSVQENDFWTAHSPRALPSYQFCTRTLFQQFLIKLVFIYGKVRLRHFLGQALRLGQARGPSAAATESIRKMIRTSFRSESSVKLAWSF